jgi:hypothetical protein
MSLMGIFRQLTTCVPVQPEKTEKRTPILVSYI